MNIIIAHINICLKTGCTARKPAFFISYQDHQTQVGLLATICEQSDYYKQNQSKVLSFNIICLGLCGMMEVCIQCKQINKRSNAMEYVTHYIGILYY